MPTAGTSTKCFQDFVKYTQQQGLQVEEMCIRDRYKDKVKYWLTFNEINCGTMPMGAILETGTIRGLSLIHIYLALTGWAIADIVPPKVKGMMLTVYGTDRFKSAYDCLLYTSRCV